MPLASTAARLAATFGIVFAHYAGAQNGPVRVLVSNGVRTVVEELKPLCERAIGHPLVIEFGTTAGLKQKIESGAAFDAALLTSEAIDGLVKESKIAGSGIPLARCGIGVGVRAGAAKPDVRTPDTLKHTLRDSKSIAYAGNGASRAYIDKMFDQLGIAADVKPKILLTDGSIAAGESVAAGQGGLVLTLVSEILPMRGIELVGPLPTELQNYVNFAGGVSAKAKTPDAAAALIQYFKSSSAAPVYKAKGMEPR